MIAFFPSILDIDKLLPTVAFGCKDNVANKYEFCQYLKTTKLGELFSDDKLFELCDDYYKYYFFIRKLLRWAKWYMYDQKFSNRPQSIDSDDEIIIQWEKNIYEIYELYRISQSVYDKILYSQLLNDHMWNPKLDPRNPKIQEYYKQKVADIIKNNNQNSSVVPETSPIETFVTHDADSQKLISSGLDADVVSIYNRSLVNINQLKESTSVDINAVKSEAAKLKYIDILIESDIIFSDFPVKKDLYTKYNILRKSVKKSLNECVELIKCQENGFDLESFYESTNFYSVSANKYNSIKLYKEFINDYL